MFEGVKKRLTVYEKFGRKMSSLTTQEGLRESAEKKFQAEKKY